MKDYELEQLLSRGEDTKTQFKENITNPRQLAEEFVAFSNSLGGKLILGVSDEGIVKGLSSEDIRRLNQMISNVSSQHVKPPIHPLTEISDYEAKKILVITIPYGNNKSYCTNDGKYITRSGADKRMISNNEMQRLFQESGKMFADEMLIKKAKWEDIDQKLFESFYQKKYHEQLDINNLPQIFENLNLASENQVNLSGMLLFGKNVTKYLPLSQLICVSFFGSDVTGTEYRDSENIEGNLQNLFKGGMAFISRNIRKVQNGKNFNTLGDPEIPLVVFEELLINALIHRDYFINANIRILIFDDSIEIISPGKLPNNLTVEKIKRGVSIRRNQTLSSFAFDVINFRGIGSGILRALKAYPNIAFENQEDIDQFKAIVFRENN
jgi:ATP-dependent DNA helicase RecG